MQRRELAPVVIRSGKGRIVWKMYDPVPNIFGDEISRAGSIQIDQQENFVR